MSDAREYVKFFTFTDDHIGDDRSGKTGQRQTMAGIPLGVIDIFAVTTDIGKAILGNGHRAAPSVFNFSSASCGNTNFMRDFIQAFKSRGVMLE